jgi:hypothetical protein
VRLVLKLGVEVGVEVDALKTVEVGVEFAVYDSVEVLELEGVIVDVLDSIDDSVDDSVGSEVGVIESVESFEYEAEDDADGELEMDSCANARLKATKSIEALIFCYIYVTF